MGTFTINYPDNEAQRILNSYCYQQGYTDTILNAEKNSIPNPESKLAFAKRMLARHVKQVIRSYEANKASEQARLSAIENADQLNIN